MKRQLKKTIASMVAVALFVSCIPAVAFAREMNIIVSDEQAISTDRRIEEVTELRTENTKYFRLTNGNTVAAQYAKPIHFLNEDSTWVDINNALVEYDGMLMTEDKRVVFSKEISPEKTLVSMNKDDKTISLSLKNASKNAKISFRNSGTAESEALTELREIMTLKSLHSEVIYKDILSGTDVKYTLDSDSIKEDIIVYEKQDSYVYSFTLSLTNMYAVMNKDGLIEIYDNNDEIIYYIPLPEVYDADKGENEENEKYIASYTLSESNGGNYDLTVTVDPEWMNRNDRVFPVTVDPSIVSTGNNVVDLYISETSRNSNYSASTSLSVSGASSGKRITYLKLSSYPVIPESAYVVKSELNLFRSSSMGSVHIGIFEALHSWNENLTWNTASYQTDTDDMLDYKYVSPNDTLVSWDITKTMKQYYEVENSFDGFALKGLYPSQALVSFHSSESADADCYPSLTVEYRDMKGLESYWSYQQQNAGPAGIGYVNCATGNLTFFKDLMTTTDYLMSVTLSLVYNSSLAGKAYTYNTVKTPLTNRSTPFGFKLNISETFMQLYADDKMIFADEDGTEHYFLLDTNDGYYYNEDDYELTAVKTNNTVELSYPDHSKKTFTSINTPSPAFCGWILSTIEDKNGNKVEITYDSSYKPIYISLKPVNESSSIRQLEIRYNSSNVPYLILNSSAKKGVILKYSSTATGSISSLAGSYLRQVIYVHGNDSTTDNDWLSFYNGNSNANITEDGTAYYSYVSSTSNTGTYYYLSEVKDGLSDRTIKYGINNGRVESVTEKVGTTEGQKMLFDYDLHTVRSSGSDDRINTADDLVTHYIFDGFGRAIRVYTTDITGEKLYGYNQGQYVEDDNRTVNNITSTLTVNEPSANYLINGNFKQNNGSYLSDNWNCTGNVSITSVGSDYLDTGAAVLQVNSGGVSSIDQTVFLPAGKYTLSFDYLSALSCNNMKLVVTASSQTDTSIIYQNEIKEQLTQISDNYQKTYLNIDVQDTINGGDFFTIKIKVDVPAVQSGQSSVKVKDIMLAKATGMTEFNYVENGGFEYYGSSGVANPGYNWTIIDDEQVTYTTINNSTNTVMEVLPGLGSQYGASQIIYTDNSAASYAKVRRFIVSGKSKIEDSFNNASGKISVNLEIDYYIDGETEIQTATAEAVFDNNIQTWQYASAFCTVPENSRITQINVICLLSDCSQVVYFDDISVTYDEGESISEYEYNEDKTKITKETYGDKYVKYSYGENDLVCEIETNDHIMSYTYDSIGRVIQEMNASYTCQSGSTTKILHTIIYNFYSYSDQGQLLSEKTNSINSLSFYYTEYSYDTTPGSRIYGALLSSSDSLNNTVTYVYDQNTGSLTDVIEADGKQTHYRYDDLGRLVEEYNVGENLSLAEQANVSYTYGIGMNNQNHKDLIGTINANGTQYSFEYDDWGNRTAVKIGSATISQQEYSDYNGKLLKTTYGNGATVNYYYDELDRITLVVYNKNTNSECTYSYEYDANGRLSAVYDTQNNEKICYTYDFLGQLIHVSVCRICDGTVLLDCSYFYDDNKLQSSRINSFAAVSANATQNVLIDNDYGYDEEKRISSYTWQNNSNNGARLDTTIEYDCFSRITAKTYSFGANNSNTASLTVTTELEYHTVPSDEFAPYATDYVDEYYSVIGDDELYLLYTYDDSGNITEIRDLSLSNPTRYTYDKLGRLIREDNAELNKTYAYTYDNAGNILTKKTYAYTTGALGSVLSTNTYTYNTSGWKDQLKKFNGVTLTYDETGNPLTYNNGSAYTFTWKNGRELATAEKGSVTTAYTYNESGNRISKTVGNVTHTYVYEGSKLISDSFGGIYVVYIYDESDSPVGMEWHENNTVNKYVFEKNLHSDVVGIYTYSGTKVVTYKYDAWGNCTTTSASGYQAVAEGNIYRYRGYIYDTETGFYWLRTRYYDPVTGRFINADSLLNGGDDLQGYNLYAYCGNNPVMYVDPNGEIPEWLLISGAVLLSVAAIVLTVATLGAAVPAAACTLSATAMYYGASAAVASVVYDVAMVGSIALVTADALYAGDFVYSTVTGNSPLLEYGFGGDEKAYEIGLSVVTIGTTEMTYLASVSPGLCFIAGTQVLAENGSEQIENIQVGDLVWATDPETGETALKEVVQLFRNETNDWIYLTVDGEEIVCTPEHPFYSPVKGWTEACKLRAGDILVTVNGEYVVVEKIEHELLENPEITYNFEVKDFHTYYVGSTEVLVHNDCGKEATPKTDSKEFKKLRGNQGYKDSNDNIWKVDQLHKNHYDVINSKGKKIREVTFDGKQIWPNGPKNKNKR